MLPITTTVAEANLILGKTSNAEPEPTALTLLSCARGPWLRLAETTDLLAAEVRPQSGRELRIYGADASSNDPSIVVQRDGTLILGRTPLTFDTLTVDRYTNLVSSYTSGNPYLPPSAAALSAAYFALSNMIGGSSGSGGGGGGDAEGGGGGSNSFVTLSNDVADVDFGSISCGFIRVIDGGYVDATSFRNLAQDWRTVAAPDVPASAFALNQAVTALSNGGHVSSSNPRIEWRNLDTGAVIASLDSDGVFCAYGGYSNLPVESVTSSLAPSDASSNVAASMAALRAVRDQTSAMASIAFAKAEDASNAAVSVSSVAASAVASVSNLSGIFSVDLPSQTVTVSPLLQFDASAGGFSGLATSSDVYAPGAAANERTPTSVAAVASVARAAAFASNLSAPLALLVAAAPTRAVQGNFASNAAAWASNAAVYSATCIAPAALMASNASRWASNAARFASNAGVFASNLAVSTTAFIAPALFASNAAWFGSNTAAGASNAAQFASNTSWAASNAATWSSNTALWTSNALSPVQRAAYAASNVAYLSAPSTPFASNAGAWASNAARYASNSATFLSNWTIPNLNATRQIADRASTTADWASNTCKTLIYIQSLSTTFTGAAEYGSNYATYAFNTAVYASNAIGPASNAAATASNVSAAALRAATFASNGQVALESSVASAQSTALLASNAAYASAQGALQAQATATGALSNAVAALDAAGRSFVTSAWASNALVVTDGAARFASNLAVLTSPIVIGASNTARFGCNAGVFASNIVTSALPAAQFASNASAYASNLSAMGAPTQAAQYAYTSNTSAWASNQVRAVTAVELPAIRSALAAQSNDIALATSVAFWASNAGGRAAPSNAANWEKATWASNAAHFGSNVANSARDAATWASNSVTNVADEASWASNWTSVTRLDVLASSNTSAYASNAAFRATVSSAWSSNAALWSSNASFAASNVSVWASNAATWASNVAGRAPLWSSNTAYFASNASAFGSNTAVWGSNASLFASNVSVFASNCAALGSNAATHYASNTAYATSNLAFPSALAAAFASNAAVHGSNTAESATLTALYGSNTGYYGSNAAYFGSNTAAWSSNVAWEASNVAFQPTFTRFYSSNAPSNADGVVSIVNGRIAGAEGGVGVSLSNQTYGMSVAVKGGYARVASCNAVLELRSDGAPCHLVSRSGMSDASACSSNAPMELPPVAAAARSNTFVADPRIALYGSTSPDAPYTARASSSNELAWCVFSQSNGVAWTSDQGYTTSSGFANVPPSYRNGAGTPTTVVDGTTYSGDWLQLDLPQSAPEAWVYAPRTYSVAPLLQYGTPGVSDGQPVRFVLAGSSNGGVSWTTLDATYATTNFAPANALINITCPRSTAAATSGMLLNAMRLIVLRVSISADSAANALFVSAKVGGWSVRAPPAVARLSANASQLLATGRVGLGTIAPAQQLHVAGSAVVSQSLGLGGVTRPAYVLELASDSAAKPASSLWSVLSDQRLKKDIEDADLERCYAIVRDVPLRRYAWREDVYGPSQTADRSRLGWIAQEVARAFPKAVAPHAAHGLPDCLDLNADQLIAALYGAVQLLQRKVDSMFGSA